MNIEEKADISKNLIRLTLSSFPRVFVSCSFGKDSRVLADLAVQVKPDIQFIGIDTGYEFEETLQFADSLITELKMSFKWIRPAPEDVRRIDAYYGDSFIKNDQYKCCAMKIPAIEKIMSEYDAWITGLRRDETEYRKNLSLIEEGRIVKVNPIAFWTQNEIWQYIREHKLSYHPLYNKGYTSLGCKPCTTSGKIREGGGRQGQFERAGRFAGTQHTGGECGLHTLHINKEPKGIK